MKDAALIIDLDGTMYSSKAIDDENREAAEKALAEARGISNLDAVALLAKTQRDLSPSISSALKQLTVPDALFEKYQLSIVRPENHLKPDPELAAALRAARVKFKTVLFTNTRRKLAILALELLSLNLEDFDLVVGGGDMETPKPSTQVISEILERISCIPSKSYTIGDRWRVDHAPGQILGLNAIVVDGRDDLVRALLRLS